MNALTMQDIKPVMTEQRKHAKQWRILKDTEKEILIPSAIGSVVIDLTVVASKSLVVAHGVRISVRAMRNPAP